MTPFSLKDKANNTSLDFNLPSSWQEITLAQMIAWEASARKGRLTFTRQLEIFTGIPEATWNNCSIMSLDTMLAPYLDWLKEPLDEASFKDVPQSVVIDGQVMPVSKDIELKTYGQYITFKTEMSNHMKLKAKGDIESIGLDFFPMAIAIYLYPEKVWDDTKVAAFADKVKHLPLLQAHPLATFFFLKFLQSLSENEKSYTTNLTISNSEPV